MTARKHTAPGLFTKHRGIALGIARDYYLPGQEADDVRQEALIALWEACRAYDPAKGAFPPFARLVIHRRLKDAVAAAAALKHRLLTGADRDMDPPRYSDPVEALEWAEKLRSLSAAERQAVADLSAGRPTRSDKRYDNALTRARRKLREAA